MTAVLSAKCENDLRVEADAMVEEKFREISQGICSGKETSLTFRRHLAVLRNLVSQVYAGRVVE